MKTYLRLLSFARPIEKFAIPYILATIIAIVFNTLNLALLAPLLQIIFFRDQAEPAKGDSAGSMDIMAKFTEYINFSRSEYGALATLQIVCGAIIVSVFLANIFRYLSQRYMEDLRVHTLLNMRKTVFYNIMNLDLHYFNNERKGDIVSKVASDVQVVQFTVTNTLQVIFKEPLQLLFYLFVLLMISVKLTLFSLLVIPVSAFIISKIVKRLKQQATRAQESLATMISFLDEALSGIRIVKAFNASAYIRQKFQDENVNYSNLTRKMVRRQQLASPVSEFLGVTMVTAIVLYGGSLILNDASPLSPQEFITYIAVFSQIMRPAKALTDSFSAIQTGIAAGVRVLDLIDTKPEMVQKPDAIVVDGFNSKISIQDVSFNYGDKTILNKVNLDIEKGKTIALVGTSGGGKSTLIDLIPRFMDPASGKILFDGTDLRDLDSGSLREQMGFVSQESVLFNDSIFNNIAFGKPGTSMEAVINAARIANAHDFIMQTSHGYDTNIGDRGNKLSGGQKQRLSIARAILMNPPILLLDEATSALDTESEKLVQEALNNLMHSRTSVVIAHRLSTIQHADKIVVIDKGEIRETGTHTELLARHGLYKRLIDMQAFAD